MTRTSFFSLVKLDSHQPRSIKCNVFDEVLREVPISVAFFFDKKVSDSSLRAAFKKALETFDIFNARLVYQGGNLTIDCNNQGAGFICVKHDFSMVEVLKDQFNPKYHHLLFDQINPKAVIKQQQPVLTAKVNYFNDGSMCLGMVWHHAIGDMDTFMGFMRAWSSALSGKVLAVPLIVTDRHVHMQNVMKPNRNQDEAAVRKLGIVEGLKLLHHMHFKAGAQRWVQFYFSEDEIANMLNAYHQETSEYLSQNDVITAHIHATLTEHLPYKTHKKGEKTGRGLDMAINFRGRTGLAQNLAGNMVSTVKAHHEASASKVQLALDIRQKVNQFADQHLDYFATLDYIEKQGGRKKIAQFVPDWLNPNGKSMLFTSWAKFGVYDLDFNHQTPCYFSTMGPALFPWITSLYEGPHNQGLIYVASLPNEMIDAKIQSELVPALHQYRDQKAALPKFISHLAIA